MRDFYAGRKYTSAIVMHELPTMLATAQMTVEPSAHVLEIVHRIQQQQSTTYFYMFFSLSFLFALCSSVIHSASPARNLDFVAGFQCCRRKRQAQIIMCCTALIFDTHKSGPQCRRSCTCAQRTYFRILFVVLKFCGSKYWARQKHRLIETLFGP